MSWFQTVLHVWPFVFILLPNYGNNKIPTCRGIVIPLAFRNSSPSLATVRANMEKAHTHTTIFTHNALFLYNRFINVHSSYSYIYRDERAKRRNITGEIHNCNVQLCDLSDTRAECLYYKVHRGSLITID